MQLLLILGIVFAIDAVTFALQKERSRDRSICFLALRQLAGSSAVSGARPGCADRRTGIDPERDQGAMGWCATAASSRNPGGRESIARTPHTRSRISDATRFHCTCAGSRGSPALHRTKGANDGPRSQDAELMLRSLEAQAAPLAPKACERTMWRFHAKTSSPNPAGPGSSFSMVRTVSEHSTVLQPFQDPYATRRT
jgi:hypothetical protein